MGHSVLAQQQVNKVCLVGTAKEDQSIAALLQEHFGMELVSSESGIEYKDDPHMVFVCNNFISSLSFKQLHSYGARILAPAIIKKRAKHSKELLIPRPRRPLFTDSMKEVRIALCNVSKRESREAVDLIHFMGGSARRKFSPATTHLIAEAVKGSDYRKAVSMGCPVVHLRWLQAAWAMRNSIEISVTTPGFMDRFLVGPFCGLSIWLLAFPEEEVVEMQRKVIEHEGRLAANEEDASHIVVANDFNASLQKSDWKQHIVTGEWFWLSIQLNYCANEEIYAWIGPKALNESSVENAEMTNFTIAVSDLEWSTGPLCRSDKRHIVCAEMLETEQNYLCALNAIVKTFKEPLEAQVPQGRSALLSKAEIGQIFSRITPLINVHERTYGELKKRMLHWTKNHLIGKVWLDNAKDLLPVYKSFLNSYDTAVETLDRCDRSRPKFHAFLKVAESRANFGRNSLKDLLVRPVQRIPSVLLLLKAIQNETERSNPDNAYLTKAMRALRDVLTLANELRKQTEAHAQLLRIAANIERFPPHIVSSAGTLTAELHVLSLGSEDEWAKTCGKSMAIFLFSDLIEIVKERNVTLSESSLCRTFKGQLPFSLFRHGKKKYKHCQKYMLASIRHIDIIALRDFEGIFVLSFRVSQGEDFWVAQFLGDDTTEMRKFLDNVSAQVFRVCGRIALMGEVRFDVDSSQNLNNEMVAAIQEALNYAVRKSCASQASDSACGGLRRAMSVMSSFSSDISNTILRLRLRSRLNSAREVGPALCEDMKSTASGRRSKRKFLVSLFLPVVRDRQNL